jgi:RimJ/RimL family protein N-acetyltransferase
MAHDSEGTTERLILRPLEMADAAQIQELFPHWEIVKYHAEAIDAVALSRRWRAPVLPRCCDSPGGARRGVALEPPPAAIAGRS